MSLTSSQKTSNYQNKIGTSTGFGTGTKQVDIDNIFYDTRCNLSYGFRPVKTQLITVDVEDDEGNAESFTVESSVVNESGGEVKQDYIQCEDGLDEVYFYHVWDWSKDLNTNRQRTVTRTIRGINVTSSVDAGGSAIPQYSVVSDTLSWTITLDKVVATSTGIPPNKDINIYIGATDDNKIFFKYNSNTRTVIKIGDVINGATVTKVLNFAESLENNIRNNTICYAEISGGTAFIADQTYTASLSGASITAVAGKGIRTRSAAVGMYIDRDHKAIDLNPVLYKSSKDTDCQQETLNDSDADYVKGRLILSNGSIPIKDKWFVVNPKSDDAKFVYNVVLSVFKLSPERDQLKSWIELFKNNKLELRRSILQDVNNLLDGDKYYELVDTCYNSIVENAVQIYNPFEQIAAVEERLSNFATVVDECNEQNINSPTYLQTSYDTVEDFNQGLSEKISNPSSNIQMPDALYKSIISNTDSLFNRIKNSLSTVQETFSAQTFYRLPTIQTAEAENESTIPLIKNAFRDVCPRTPKIDMLPENITVDDSKFDIINALNIITTQLYSIPRFNFSTISNTSNFNISTSTDDGYLMSVTATAGTITISDPLNPSSTITVPSIDIGPGGTELDQGLQPHVIWSATSGVQSVYKKDFRFRSVEFSDNTSKLATLRGNSFKENPIFTRITKDISSSDTTIHVRSTSGFLSSGYLMIPKFVRKLEVYGNGNVKPHFFYEGEEIIYYSGKTNTSFTGCVRGRYGTSSTLSTSLTPYSNNTGSTAVSTGYQEGNSITQYYNYKLES